MLLILKKTNTPIKNEVNQKFKLNYFDPLGVISFHG